MTIDRSQNIIERMFSKGEENLQTGRTDTYGWSKLVEDETINPTGSFKTSTS